MARWIVPVRIDDTPARRKGIGAIGCCMGPRVRWCGRMSLEQDREWADFVTRRLRKNAIHNVELRYVPLMDYGSFVWYDVESVALPEHVELVLCDGPAVFEEWGEAHAQWRYGLLPVLASRDVKVDRLLLDDATEPRAAGLLRRWRQEFVMVTP